FVRDLVAATTEQVNLSSSGAAANRDSWEATISANGRYVAFLSDSSNLVAARAHRCPENAGLHHFCNGVFVRDRSTDTTHLASVTNDGTPANGDARNATISTDGRYVAFASKAANLADDAPKTCVNPDDSRHHCYQVYLRDLQQQTTELVSL